MVNRENAAFRKVGIAVVLLMVAVTSWAQKVDLEHWQAMRPRNIGPAGMSGRVTSIDVVNDKPSIIFAGTASGGVWRSKSGGIKWEPIFDKQPTQSIGAVAVCQSNPSIVWAGSGEGNPRNSQTSGGGIFKSLDGGETWKMMGLEATKTIHRIIIDPTDPATVYAAALGSAWGTNPERGVFKTTDGGVSWEKILYINDSTGCADLIIDPTNPQKMWAAMWQYGRSPWNFISGGPGSGLYMTYDGGKTWKEKTEAHGLPKGELGRIGLTVCQSRPNIVYALIESKKTALYRSDDGGETWKMRADKNVGNRPFYYADIFVDPQNENRIYNLHSVITISEDGGKTFRNFVPWTHVHPDHHAFWIHPENPDFLIDGNDGGLNISRDRGETWRFVENLPLAQFYHINYDQSTPYNVYGGMQDNGSWIGPSQVWKQGGIRNSDWQEVVFGDGFDVVPQPGNNRFGYAMYQGGNLNRYDRETGRQKFIQPNGPEGQMLRFNWNAAIAIDPGNDCGIYFGSQFVHHSSDCGETWRIISPDLTTNDTRKQQQAKSGGLTIDATKAENNTTITAISPSRINQQIIWVGTDDGNLQLTTNGGNNWTNLAGKLPGAPTGAWFPQIEVSPHNAREAFIILNHYRRNDWEPYVYHTTDLGQTFTRLVTGKDVSGHAHTIVQDTDEPGLLFLGTENGLYFSIDKGKNWNKWTNGYPSVSTIDLKIHPRENDLIIGTFGRAAWILDDIEPLRALARKGKALLTEDFVVFDPSQSVQAVYRQADGTRFVADAHFKGQNERPGALLTCWVKDPKPKSSKGEKGKGEAEEEDADEGENESEKEDVDENGPAQNGKINVYILDNKGDTIRYFTQKPDTGINRFRWDLRRDGVHFPAWRKFKPNAARPAGALAAPGKYQVRLRFGEFEGATEVIVLPDPREPYDPEAWAENLEWRNRHQAVIKTAFDSFERLKAAQEGISTVNSLLESADKATKEELQKEGKALGKKIETLQLEFMTAKDFNGYDHYTVRLNDLLYRAISFLEAEQGRPTGNGMAAVELAQEKTNAIASRVNEFLKTEWQPYLEKVKAAKLQLLPELEPVKPAE